MFCPKCNTTYSASKTIINLQNLPVDEEIDPKFCPVCGWHPVEDSIVVNEMNVFDKVTRYNHCIVEILENTVTGEVSVGWNRTDETEELEDD